MYQEPSTQVTLNHGSVVSTHASQFGSPRESSMQIRMIMNLFTSQTQHIATILACLTQIGLSPLNKIYQSIRNSPMHSSIQKTKTLVYGMSPRLKSIYWSIKKANTTITRWVFSDLPCSIRLTARETLRALGTGILMNRETGIAGL